MSSAFKTKLVFSSRWAAIPATKTSKGVGCKEESFDSILPGIESISLKVGAYIGAFYLLLPHQGNSKLSIGGVREYCCCLGGVLMGFNLSGESSVEVSMMYVYLDHLILAPFPTSTIQRGQYFHALLVCLLGTLAFLGFRRSRLGHGALHIAKNMDVFRCIMVAHFSPDHLSWSSSILSTYPGPMRWISMHCVTVLLQNWCDYPLLRSNEVWRLRCATVSLYPKSILLWLASNKLHLSIEQPHLLPIQGFPATACSSVPCAPPPRHRYHGTAPAVAQPWEMDSGCWQLALWTSELLPVRYGFTPSPGCSLGHQEWTFSLRKEEKLWKSWISEWLRALQLYKRDSWQEIVFHAYHQENMSRLHAKSWNYQAKHSIPDAMSLHLTLFQLKGAKAFNFKLKQLPLGA